MDIGEVLSKAWQIVWKHKVLWIFGILAGCAGGRSAPSLNYQFNRSDFNWRGSPDFPPFNFPNVPEWQTGLIVTIAIAVVLLLIVLALFLGTVGQAGLARGTFLADQGASRLSFGELFGEGMRYFWRVLGMNLLVLLLSILGVIFVGIPLAVITCGLGFLLIIVILWFVQIVQEQAVAAIVVEDLSAMDGLRRGWQVVRGNLGRMTIMGLILLLGIGLIGGLLIAAPFLAVIVPALLVPVVTSQGSNVPVLGVLGIIALCFAAYLPIALVLGGLLRSYIGSAWTLTFLRLTRQSVAPAVEVDPSRL